jgi:excisionase family DNA binding protein
MKDRLDGSGERLEGFRRIQKRSGATAMAKRQPISTNHAANNTESASRALTVAGVAPIVAAPVANDGEMALNAGCVVPSEVQVALAKATTGSIALDPQLPKVLTPAEVAALLRVRPRSVYEAIKRCEFPGVRRIGRKIRIDRDCVLDWLAHGQGRVSRSSRR